MQGVWIILGYVLGISMIAYFIISLSNAIAFREFLIMLYGINYLLSPAIIYSIPEDLVVYPMRIPPEQYFPLAIIGMLGLILGVYTLKNATVFKPNLELLSNELHFNVVVLKQWVVGGIIISFIGPYFPGEISFFLYLMGLIRFIGALGLFAIDYKKNWVYVIAVITNEFFHSLQYGLFHDFLMWLVFFGIFFMYLSHLSVTKKILLFLLGLYLTSIIQNAKSDYRTMLVEGRGGVGSFVQTAITNSEYEEDDFFKDKNFISTVTRINQAWIFSSTVRRMDRYKDFQGLALVKQYAKAAILPRFLAPDKLNAGNKEIFNRFSGHTINPGTSMGLGIFADGYVAYGFWGVLLFGYALGLIFALVFRLMQNWIKVSPFFFLFMFSVLNYAVRPDCEVQTILGHVFKSVLVYSIIVWYYSKYFRIRFNIIQDLIDEGMIEQN